MRGLLDDLRHVPTPAALTSRDGIADATKGAYEALLRSATGAEEAPKDGSAVSELRRFGMWLEDLALSSEAETEEATACLELASGLFEFAGRLQPNEGWNIFFPPLNDLLRSSALGSVGPYYAQAATIARRVGDRLRYELAGRSDLGEQVHLEVALCVVSLLGRDLLDAFTRGLALRPLAQEAVKLLSEQDAPNREMLLLDRAVAIALAASKFAAGMLIGADSVMAQALKDIDRAEQLAEEIAEANYAWLARSVGQVMKSMRSGSVHAVLSRDRSLDPFRRALVRTGVFELWEPQKDAIAKGIIAGPEAPNFVVSIPTGAGKTLIAELAIVNALRQDDSWALYVAPSRALANQVSNDLRKRLPETGITVRTVLAGAEQSMLLSDELELVSRGKSVTVITPEKLDAYYRNAKELFSNCRLAIFDEVHKLADEQRGPLIESLISRFLVLNPDVRIVLLSGAISNYEELAAWLGSATETVAAKRRPNRQVRGLAVRYDLTPREPREGRTATTRRIDFGGGLVLVHEAEDLNPALDMQLPNMFSGFFTEELRGRGWFESSSSSPHSTRNQHAAAIAASLSKTGGTVLVFCQTTTEAESSCRTFALGGRASEAADQRSELSAFLAAELGKDHELVSYVLEGKAYHHARLPPSAQRAIELGLEQGWLLVVFATSTLREGLNTPASYVIVAGDAFYDETKEQMVGISEADFENIAGRAGRPFRETEGLIVLVPNRLATARSIAKRYLLIGEDALRAKSQLDSLARALDGSPDDVARLSTAQQALLLGLQAAGLSDAHLLERFFEQTLWAVQESDESMASRVAARSSHVVEETIRRVGDERFAVASRTGFSLTSVETIASRVADRADDLSAAGLLDTIELLRSMLESVAHLPEVDQGILRRAADWSLHKAALAEWIAGSDYDAILRVAKDVGVLRPSDNLGDAVRYASDLSMWLSWAFGAAALIAQSEIADVDQRLTTLPLLVKYGVPTPEAAFICMLGVNDRAAAQNLADRFREKSESRGLSDVASWLESVDDELDSLFGSQTLRLELLRRQAFGHRRGELPFIYAGAKPVGEALPGEVLNIYPEGESLVLRSLSGETKGELVNPAAAWDFARGDIASLAAIFTSGSREGHAAVSLIRPRITP